MMLKNKKLLLAIFALILTFAIAAGSVATYAWFQSQTQTDVIYEIPTARHRIIKFDSTITKDVRGTLYPAVLSEEAVKDNAVNDPSYIQTPAGHVTFAASFTMYTGERPEMDENGNPLPRAPLRLSVASEARLAGDVNSRNLLETGELEALISFNLKYKIIVSGAEREITVPIRLNGRGILSIADPDNAARRIELGRAESAGYIVYIASGLVKVVESKNYVPSAGHVMAFQNGYMMALPDVAVAVSVDAYLTTVDELTSPDLKRAKVQIALSVISPDVEEAI